MFVVFLKITGDRARAGEFMDGHKAWIERGFDDGVFLVTGSLQPKLGGGIIAHNSSLPDLQARVDEDPFVAQGIASAEIYEISPAKADDRLDFLLA